MLEAWVMDSKLNSKLNGIEEQLGCGLMMLFVLVLLAGICAINLSCSPKSYVPVKIIQEK